MIYAVSDTHGYDFEKFTTILEKAGFSDDDFLFVLGDVIDRGSDGVKYLTWLINTPNAQLILGNHEEMLLSCDFIFEEITVENIGKVSIDKITSLSAWQLNGADPTLEALRELRRRDPDTLGEILEYLREAPLFETVSIGERDYLLTHSGLGNFRQGKKISAYESHDLLWNRPDINDRYFDDITTIFGHTPTEYYGSEYTGKILVTDTWIDIDTGAAMGNSPTVLRLDDMRVFKA